MITVADSLFFALALGALGAFAVTALAVPLLRPLARRVGLVDHPDRRKQHASPTPLTGGLAIVIGLGAGIALMPGIGWAPTWTLLAGALVLLIVGLLDDIHDISATLRLLVQIGVAALMVYGGGLELQVLGPLFGPGFGPIGLNIFSGIFTIACVVFMINAVNMMDGLDGLAGGAAMIMLTLLFVVAALDGAPLPLIVLPLVLAASTAGFLAWNLRRPFRPRAKVFLGDTGSTVLGFTVAWLAVVLGSRPGSSVYPITLAWVLLIPAMDTLALFIRRLKMRRSPFAPDRAHLHHLIHRSGYRVSTTVYLLYIAVLATGLVGVLGWQLNVPQWLLFIAAAAILTSYPIMLLNAHRIVRWKRRSKNARRARNAPDAIPKPTESFTDTKSSAAPKRRARELNMSHSSGRVGTAPRRPGK